MKPLLNWQNKEVVNCYDEVSLWSAPFGSLLLKNIPMQGNVSLLDIGFGTGFPLIELSQRFTKNSKFYGVDIWEEAIEKTREKIRVFGIKNIEIIRTDAKKISLESESIDCVTSNLGINNFSDKPLVLKEINRLLKPEGNLCITTNTNGTFEELHVIFKKVVQEMNLSSQFLENHFKSRGSEETTIAEIEDYGFTLIKKVNNTTVIRFADAEALFNHSFVRIAFRESWESFVPKNKLTDFFERSTQEIQDYIEKHGEFQLTVPLLYLHFKK